MESGDGPAAMQLRLEQRFRRLHGPGAETFEKVSNNGGADHSFEKVPVKRSDVSQPGDVREGARHQQWGSN